MKEYILSNDESRKVDNFAINKLNIPGIRLMRTAGNYVSLKAKLFLKQVPGSRIDIFCGTGNNGGDGFVSAIDLVDMGAFVHVWIAGDPDKIQGDALYFYEKCIEEHVNIQIIDDENKLHFLDDLNETDIIIDALLGTGFNGEVRGVIKDIIKIINSLEHPIKHPVLSVDIPSGINGDTGEVGGVAVQAMKTVTMGFLKRGLLFNEGKKYAGEIILADLGYPPESFSVLESETYLFHKFDLTDMFPKIDEDAYKHSMGKILVIAGSPGMTGAATLTCKAAQRSGAGLVVNAIPESLNSTMEIKLTEALTLPVKESKDKTFMKESVDDIKEKIEWCDIVVFGPGVSDNNNVKEFGLELVKSCQKPMIIDADGLRIFKDNLNLILSIKDLIITPHIGELSDITGVSISEIKRDKIEFSKAFVKKYPCVLVLKDAHTITVAPDDTTAVNSTGNPGLATGGTGDVLTGMIAAFYAQGLSSFDAATAAVAIHGLAADVDRERFGIRGIIASDIVELIPQVLKEYDRIR